MTLLAALLAPHAVLADAKGSVSGSQDAGYGRMVFTFDQLPEFDAKVGGGVLVLEFKSPVEVGVDRLPAELAAYISAARRDPDGGAVRFGLTRPVTVNTMRAGEKLFVDLLPQGWKGMPPGLPQDVVDEISRRAREAEEAKAALRREREKDRPPMRVSAGSYPTFMRIAFDLGSTVPARFETKNGRGVVTVDAPLDMDLATARAALPGEISGLEVERGEDSTTVSFKLPQGAAPRTFREDDTLIVDFPREGALAEDHPRSIDEAATIADRKAAGGADDHATAAGPEAGAATAAAHDDAAKAEAGGHAGVAADTAAKPETAAKTETAVKADAAAKTDAAATAFTAPLPRPKPKNAPDMAAADTPKAADTVATHVEAQPDIQAKATTDLAAPAAAAAKVEIPVAAKTDAAAGTAAGGGAHAEVAIAADAKPATRATTATPAATTTTAAPADPADESKITLRRDGKTLQFDLPVATSTPIAVYMRGDDVMIIIDRPNDVDFAAVAPESGGLITSVEQVPIEAGRGYRLKLSEPRLITTAQENDHWSIALGDTITVPTKPLALVQGFALDGRPIVTATLTDVGRIHWIEDPERRQRYAVATARGPARGLLRAQEFVEFSAAVTAHGIVIQPNAEDVTVRASIDQVVVARDNGLAISSIAVGAKDPDGEITVADLAPSPFSKEAWQKETTSSFHSRQSELMEAAAAAGGKRSQARGALAMFYFARGFMPEAKAVLDAVGTDDDAARRDSRYMMMKAATLVKLGRPREALLVLDSDALSRNTEAQLWRAAAEADLGNYGRAREAMRRGESALKDLPPELQVSFGDVALRVAVESRDFATASAILDEVDSLVADSSNPRREVLRGRVYEGLGQAKRALETYQSVMAGRDEIAMAEARFRSDNLRLDKGELDLDGGIAELESFTTVWRGDDLEAQALAKLGELYAEKKRWRDAFTTMRTALEYHPEAPSTAALQDSMSKAFARLYLDDNGSKDMSSVDALALYYDFKELTPPGRMGDELIRRLADRLVAVDLLDKAAELLEYQVDKRLAGAARAQVAARAAIIHLMNHKPARAYKILQDTRQAALPAELVRSRLILEARALADIGRTDMALEMLEPLEGPEIDRLRSDVLWQAQRWQEAAEAIERMTADAWRKADPLSDTERTDVLRAAIAYSLADDALGLDRLRSKYAAKFGDSPDAIAFDVVTQPIESRGEAFRDVARKIASIDTFKGFLEEYRARYPDAADGKPNGGPSADARTSANG